MDRIPEQLITLVKQPSTRPVSPGVRALSDEILAHYGSAAQAILFYGDCLRTGDDRDGILDLYLIVDSYRSAYSSRGKALLNKLLPPNVFYMEHPFEDRVIRAKYAVLSLNDFQKGTSMRWFHSYLWARFAQPTGLLYVRNNQIAKKISMALACAVMTFITRVLPRAAFHFSAGELWQQGLFLSYRAELRAERKDQLARLFDVASEHFEKITQAAVAEVPFPVKVVTSTKPKRYFTTIPNRVRYFSQFAWDLRCIQGKLLSVLRLLKGLSTFQGGLNYILWKIERHSGVRVEVDPRMKRHPVLGGFMLFWRLYRQGAFR
jgi:hypothetical protein